MKHNIIELTENEIRAVGGSCRLGFLIDFLKNDNVQTAFKLLFTAFISVLSAKQYAKLKMQSQIKKFDPSV